MVTAILVMIVAWLSLAAMLFALQTLATKAHPQLGFIHVVSQLFTWIASPCFGAYAGILVSARLFRTTEPRLVAVSVMSLVAAFVLLLVVVAWSSRPSVGWDYVLVLIFQVGGIIGGVKLGEFQAGHHDEDGP